ncbi:MAG: hypothetical protein ACKV1O_13490 [Saprospiraceae bacterium]
MKKYVFIVLSMVLWQMSGTAQSGRWLAWEPLYNDSYISVEVQFYLPSTTSCQPGGKDFKYKYRVKGKYRNTPYFLSWKMDYIDCNGDLNYQVNSVEIGKSNPDDISSWVSVESIDYRFTAATLEAKHYEEEASSSPNSGSGTKALQFSRDPDRIEGIKKVYIGQNIELSVKGGSLGIGADWIWYQDSCGGKKLGRGKSIRLTSSDSFNVFVRAEGKNNTTNCVRATVDVDKNSLAPSGIGGRDKICKGETAVLTVSGGVLGMGATWVWYTNSCSGKKIGTGNSLNVTPTEATTYFVRAEGSLNTTNCANITVSVYGKSFDPDFITASTTTICEGQRLSLSVNGGKLSQDATWQWYANGCGGTALASGASVSLNPSSTTTYYVRAEGVCNNTSCVSLKINVDRKLLPPRSVIAPQVIYRGKKTELSVQGENLPAGAEWRWYKGTCDSGSYLGSGSSITIRPQTNATYSVKAVGKCNETSCAQTQVVPIKLRTVTTDYSDRKKILHFGWGAGLEWIDFQALAQHSTLGVVNYDYTKIQGFGSLAELSFHPIMKENFSLGLVAGGGLGTTPLIFDEGKKTKSDGTTIREKYFYTRWNYGSELAFGFNTFKFLLNINKLTQNNRLERFVNEGSIGEEEYRFNEKLNWETIGAGMRFGRYLEAGGKGGYNFDILYSFTQNTQKDFLGFDFNNFSGSIHGISISWWRHNSFKFKIDLMSQVEGASLSDLENSTALVSFILIGDRFY